MDSNDAQIEPTKKPYKKPEAKQFPLRPEEAVLGFCKGLAVGSGPAHPTGCFQAIFCQTSGS